jgi:uncharacterized protein DUF748
MATEKHAGSRAGRGFLGSRKFRIIAIVIGALIIIRLILPYVILHYANKTLATMPGYYGHIDDIDLSLYRGAYQVDKIYLNKRDSASGKQTDFFKASLIDLSVEWRALFKGSIVGELEVHDPAIIFTKDKTELSDVKKDTSDFRKLLKDFMPLKVNRFEIFNGSVHYVDKGSKPPVDVSIKKMHVLATNLNNSYDSSVLLPATVRADGKAYGGDISLNMRLDALAKEATFDLNAEVKNTNLVLLNDFMQAYADFDVNKGNFGLYTEVAAKNGKFKGYVKPVIKDLDVVGKEDRKDPFLRKLWESVVGGVGVIFRNQKKDQIATRVPLEGSFKDVQTDVWETVWEVLRNAFIQALLPSVDNQININSVGADDKKDDRSLFQKILGTGKDKEDDKAGNSRKEKREERKKERQERREERKEERKKEEKKN